MKIVMLMLAFAGLSMAQLPEAPAARVTTIDRKFVVVESALAVSLALDAYTTIERSGDCYETDSMLGQHPSTAKVTVFMASQMVGMSAISYLLKKKLGGRMHGAAWLAPSIYAAAGHGEAGIRNVARGCFR
ncbi:MAG: hypothetical protein ABI383_01105 [Acidobacteriaceae bacterium]